MPAPSGSAPLGAYVECSDAVARLNSHGSRFTARKRTLPSATRSYALFTSASGYLSAMTFTFPFAA